MTEQNPQERKEKIFKAVMTGLMVGSGVFLALRYLVKLDTDLCLIAGTGLGVAVGLFLLKQVETK